jgi:hypothetical protein
METPTVEAVSVLRLGADVAERFRTARRDAGYVHSVFGHVVNLAWHDGRLVSLQGPGRLVAPFAVEASRLPRSRGLRAGAPVWRRGDIFALDGVTVAWRGAGTAETAMPASARGPAPALSVLLAEPWPTHAPALSSGLGATARARLAAGIHRRDPDTFIAGACALLGLGEGLTPAGDDCVVGALAVIHRFAPAWLAAHPQIRATVGQTAASATTAIAREFVAHAAAGHFAELVIDVLTAESVTDVGHSAARLARTGATSGADTVAEMRLALAALGRR